MCTRSRCTLHDFVVEHYRTRCCYAVDLRYILPLRLFVTHDYASYRLRSAFVVICVITHCVCVCTLYDLRVYVTVTRLIYFSLFDFVVVVVVTGYTFTVTFDSVARYVPQTFYGYAVTLPRLVVTQLDCLRYGSLFTPVTRVCSRALPAFYIAVCCVLAYSHYTHRLVTVCRFTHVATVTFGYVLFTRLRLQHVDSRVTYVGYRFVVWLRGYARSGYRTVYSCSWLRAVTTDYARRYVCAVGWFTHVAGWLPQLLHYVTRLHAPVTFTLHTRCARYVVGYVRTLFTRFYVVTFVYVVYPLRFCVVAFALRATNAYVVVDAVAVTAFCL